MIDICNQLKKIYKMKILPETTSQVKLISEKYSCPDEVKHSFQKLTRSVQYTYTIQGHLITVSFFYKGTDRCLERFKHIIVMLLLLQPSHPVNIDILFSPIKKVLPSKGTTLGQDHINTGYSMNNDIVVYREEEWFKVFIHECFHGLGFDHHLESVELNNKLLEVFKIPAVEIRESYCEVWARILNCCAISAFQVYPIDQLLHKERNHSCHQMAKVLKHMNMNYTDLYSTNSYIENTNVFAYVILGAILMQKNVHFIEWCSKNKNIFKIDKDRTLDYVDLILTHKDIKHIYHPLDNSTKMSINNIELIYENT